MRGVECPLPSAEVSALLAQASLLQCRSTRTHKARQMHALSLEAAQELLEQAALHLNPLRLLTTTWLRLGWLSEESVVKEIVTA